MSPRDEKFLKAIKRHRICPKCSSTMCLAGARFNPGDKTKVVILKCTGSECDEMFSTEV